MLAAVLALAIVLLPAGVIGTVVLRDRMSTPSVIATAMSNALAVNSQPVRTYETYGHPAPPIPLLGASLPHPPIGFGWEITVARNDDDNPSLRLTMLDLSTATEVDRSERDMVVIRRWQYANDDTYIDFYRRSKDSETAGKVMTAHLINPLVTWAQLLNIRYTVEHPDRMMCNYMLIEGGKEPAHV